MSEKKVCPDCGSPDCRRDGLSDYDDEFWTCDYRRVRALEKVVAEKDAEIAKLRAAVVALAPVYCDKECVMYGDCVRPYGCPNTVRDECREAAGLED